ncbi:hypothetical protein ACHAWF_012534 [Thalassiosira exigua]
MFGMPTASLLLSGIPLLATAFALSVVPHVDDVEATSGPRSSRRAALRKIAAATASIPLASSAARDDASLAVVAEAAPPPSTVVVPLEYVPALSAYVVRFCLFGERFGAIVDTGSPFLTVPSTCSARSYKYKWGCYRPELTKDSGYANTVEGFDNNQGPVVWRKAGFAFDEEDAAPRELTFGVFGPDLLDGPGGVFFGLIKKTDKWIRPSFLSQTGYASFRVDLRETPQLTLSERPMIEDDDCVPLVRDLNRRYGSPVVHYAARPSKFVVNGFPLQLERYPNTFVIFDTGLSGMAVSDELFEGRNLQARKNKEKSLWGTVNVAFETRSGREVELAAMKPITTPLGKDTRWTKFKGNLIVLGLAFLDGRAMTIDADDGKVQFSL